MDESISHAVGFWHTISFHQIVDRNITSSLCCLVTKTRNCTLSMIAAVHFHVFYSDGVQFAL